MSVLGSDTFARTGTTLGTNWVEQAGGALATNMSTDLAVQGGVALIDTQPTWHVATYVGTSQSNQYVQCWVQSPNVNNNAGIVMRYIDNANFYFAILVPTQGLFLYRRRLAANVLLAGPVAVGVGSSTWYRISGQIVGNIITVYVDNTYNTVAGREGPQIRVDDSAGPPVTGSGLAGITSTGNNATGASGPMWNDFIAFDGSPQTIYIDPAFTGGVPGNGMGTQDRPDYNIDWALNNAGTVGGGVIEIDSDGPIGNGGVPQYSLGHEGKFNDAGWSFPAYSVDNGRVTNPGAPNLTIQSGNSYRAVLTETRNTNFFTLRSDATGIVFRGLSFDLTGGIASTSVHSDVVAPADRSFTVDKCTIGLNAAALIDQGIYVEACSQFRALFNYFNCPTPGIANYRRFIGINGQVPDLQIKYNVFDARDSELDAGIYVFPGVAIGVADVWDLDHNHYVDVSQVGAPVSVAVSLTNPGTLAGMVEVQNSLFYGGAAVPPGNTDYGIYTLLLGVAGTVNAHHNTYYNVTTPRDVGVTDGGNEIDNGPDPDFPPNLTYIWQHTEGGNGFRAIRFFFDLRPRSGAYLNNADDATALQGVLDRGALQGYALPADQFEANLVCTAVIYDPDGPNEIELGGRLVQMRPLTQEKDVELRSYRASDTELQFADTEGIFLESNANTFLTDTAGDPNWYGKEVLIIAYYQGVELHRYIGFVIGVTSGRGVGTLRLGNRFQFLFGRPVMATHQGRVLDETGAFSTAAAFPITVNLGVCRVETWTFTFNGAYEFEVEGSETGFDGSGTIGLSFTSNTGAITVDAAWANAPFNVGDQVQITTEWRSEAGNFIDDLYKAFLLSAQGAGLADADLDTAIDDLAGSSFDPPVVEYVIDQPTSVLDVIDEISRHVGGVTIEKANARIDLNIHLPRLLSETPDTLCRSQDLMEADVDHIPIINEFKAEWGYNKNLLRFSGGTVFPQTDDENDSFIKYGRRFPARRTLQFRGFDQSNQSWIEFVLISNYLRWRDPRREIGVRTTVERLNANLDTLYRIQSEAPTFNMQIVEVFQVSKNLINLAATMKTIDGYPFYQVDGDCGFLSYDTPGQGYDQCWGYI